jgi:hypothetical protein
MRRDPRRPARALEEGELLARPVEATGTIEVVVQSVAQLEEMDRILRRVVEHALRERTHRPIGTLEFLVELHAEVALEERGEAKALDAEQLRGEPGVEDVANQPAVILAQEAQVVVSVVKDDFDPGILEQLTQRRRLPDGYRVEDCRMLPGRELEQIDSIDEAVEARTFGVERQDPRVRDRRQERVDSARRIEINRRMHVGNLTGILLAPESLDE